MSQSAFFLLNVFLWVFLIVCVFDLTRTIVVSGPSIKTVSALLALVVVGAVIGFLNFLIHGDLRKPFELSDAHRPVQLPADWGKSKTAEAREKGSKAYAAAAYMGYGLLLKYLNKEGNWVTFQPTPEDLANRADAVRIRVQLAEKSQSFWRDAVRWWLGVLLAGVMGLVEGRRRRRLAANPKSGMPARKGGARP